MAARVAYVVPAFMAGSMVGDVCAALLAAGAPPDAIFVVDDGSTDGTAAAAEPFGVRVLSHSSNRGKGAALRTGFDAAYAAGFDAAVTLDADGQHPADEAVRLASLPLTDALVLGIRNLEKAGAPRANQISNRISNWFLSKFSRCELADTQCGLRRYPLPMAIELDAPADGYAFEAEIILRAIAAGVPIVEVPIEVIYPDEEKRVTHFDSVRDPARIVRRVVTVLFLTGGIRRAAPKRTVRSRPEAPDTPVAESAPVSSDRASDYA